MDFISILYVGIVVVIAELLSFFPQAPGIGTVLSHFFNRTFLAEELDLSILLFLYRKGIISWEEFLDRGRNYGYNNERLLQFKEANKPILDVNTLTTLYFRYQDQPNSPFHISEEKYTSVLKSHGYDDNDISLIKESQRVLPGVDDVIRFSVREVYNPVLRKKGNLDAEIDEEYLREMKRRGVSEQDARNIWAAHWNVPSILQAFEFLHRLYDHPNDNVRFTSKDLDEYFTVADIAPGYRKRLEAISYNPLTRVDVRRMYRVGIFGKQPDGSIDDEKAKKELTRQYRELGYNDVNAERLAEFTIAYESEDERELSKSQILSFYREGIIEREGEDSASELLKQLGYSDNAVEFMLDYEDLKLITDDEREEIETIKEEFLNGEINDESTLRSKLVNIPLPIKKVESYIKQFKREKRKLQKRLPQSKAEKYFRLGIIKEDEFREILKSHNVNPKDIDILVEANNVKDDDDLREPSLADLKAFLKEGFISEPEFIQRMRDLHYADTDIVLYAKLVGKELTDEDFNLANNPRQERTSQKTSPAQQE